MDKAGQDVGIYAGYMVNNEYTLIDKIGSGAFGQVFLALSGASKKKFAAKLEKASVRTPRLILESQMYKRLEDVEFGIPKCYWYGQSLDLKYNVLVVDYVGKSLKEHLENCSNHFSLKTVLLIAEQLFSILRFIHERSCLHRDIKPANFVVGSAAGENKIYMIDFGLSDTYRDDQENHVPNVFRHKVGNPLYASRRVHEGMTPSRRDDMESLAYMLIYFLKGKLPWSGLPCSKRVGSRWLKIGEAKWSTSVEDICQDCPPEFATLVNYSRNLDYEEAPNYEFLRILFQVLARKEDIVYDYQYDWMTNGSLAITENGDSSRITKRRNRRRLR